MRRCRLEGEMRPDDRLRPIGAIKRDDTCHVCGTNLWALAQAYRGFYGQALCGVRCRDAFNKRMHRSQDTHARGGFR